MRIFKFQIFQLIRAAMEKIIDIIRNILDQQRQEKIKRINKEEVT